MIQEYQDANLALGGTGLGIIKSAFIYLYRNPVKTTAVCLIISIIFLGELLGFGLYTTAVEGKRDAYIYNGFALDISGEDINLTEQDYDMIEELEHVTGVGGHFREIIVTPVSAQNVKEHTGAEPESVAEGEEGDYHADNMVIVAMMNIPMYEIFRWEKSVSIVDGTFADSANRGIMIEKRFAEQNQIHVGDSVSFHADDLGQDISVTVCGIYYVDSDFEILDTNTMGDGVYVYSPYNAMYMDYEYASALFGLETSLEEGCTIYVDAIENVSGVAEKLKNMFGKDITLYDNTTNYLENECRIIGILEQLSFVICFFVLTMGSILLLVAFSFFFDGFKRDVGIYMAFGESKAKCFARYSFITLFYIISGLLVFGLFYLLFSKGIIHLANRQIMSTIGSSVGGAIAPYETPNLRQGFSVSFENRYMLNGANIIRILAVAGCCFILSFAIPLASIIKGKPKQLMSSREG